MERTILLVEDDEALRASCAQALTEASYRVLEASLPSEAESLLCREAIDLVITDLRMPGGGGEAVLQFAADLGAGIPVIVITAFPTVQSAIDAFKHGVVDYLLKPFTEQQLLEAVEGALEKEIARDHAELLRSATISAPGLEDMIGCSRSFNEMLASIRRLAPLPGNVLITGETGAGKELAARALHRLSPRHDRPFCAINCAAVPQELFEAELFGFEKGAFTGAHAAKPGIIEQASGGTVLLDEVDELSPPAQAKLLRAIEEKAGRRIGSVATRRYDVRFFAATNKDLRELAETGKFRPDLFYRLAVLELRVPPLRERPEDIPRLAVHFLDRLKEQSPQRNVHALSEAALDRLAAHSWPGNVRELENVIHRAFARARGPLVTAEDITASIDAEAEGGRIATSAGALPRERALGSFERHYLLGALERHGGNVTQTARALGIHRTTLQRLMRKYGIRMQRR